MRALTCDEIIRDHAGTFGHAFLSQAMSTRRSRNALCAEWIFARAVSIVNHSARSTSGNSWILPDRGGHSIEKRLLRIDPASQSPSMAQARTNLPEVSF